MMHEHILKAVLSQGGSALGRFVRWWLLVLAGSVCVLTWQNMQDGAGLELSIVVALVLTATLVAIPAAVVVAIAFVAIKF